MGVKIFAKPLVWGLFAAGGTLAAFLCAPLIFAIGLGVPLGLIPAESLAYERVITLLASPLVRVVLFLTLSLFLWHSAHRLRITAHDLGIYADRHVMRVCYGLATIGTICSAAVLITL
jgi:fumarate reductase subunit D